MAQQTIYDAIDLDYDSQQNYNGTLTIWIEVSETSGSWSEV